MSGPDDHQPAADPARPTGQHFDDRQPAAAPPAGEPVDPHGGAWSAPTWSEPTWSTTPRPGDAPVYQGPPPSGQWYRHTEVTPVPGAWYGPVAGVLAPYGAPGHPATDGYGTAVTPAAGGWGGPPTPPGGYAGGYPVGWYGAPVPPTAPPARRGGKAAIALGAALVLIAGGVAIGTAVNRTSSVASPDASSRQTQQFPGFGSQGNGSQGNGSQGNGSQGNGSGGTGAQGNTQVPGSGTGTSASVTSPATDDQSQGIVVIDTVLGYQNAEAAGTGMVLSSDGTVLTNNHVVQGSTSIKATVMSTGRTYNATVVGTDKADDVAVIKLTGASGLATVSTDTTSNVSVGTAIVAVGNAGGTGDLTAATGEVTALDQTITATDESGANAEQLDGLYQTNAAIEAGDSGGPLFDGDGDVVGINTAASTSRSGATQAGYAIPIGSALTIAKQIVAGRAGSGVVIGLPAFLGVQLSGNATTPTISAVIDGLPADQAGLAAGDTITAIDGAAVGTAADLSKVLDAYGPGDRITVDWTTAAGDQQSAQVTLVPGPAD